MMIAAIPRGVEIIAWSADGTRGECFQELQEKHKDEDRGGRVQELEDPGKNRNTVEMR